MPRTLTALLLLMLAACTNSPAASSTPSPSSSPSGSPQGLIAYASDRAVGVLDPVTGKATAVAPLPPGAFRIAGPVWAPAPGVTHPVIYFTVHDDRTPERRTTAGVVPYDWLFRLDPFAGSIEPLGAMLDQQSNGPIGLVANSHYLAFTVGCCATYEVHALDLTRSGPFKVLAKPPQQSAFFTEGAVPGTSGLIAVRAFGTGNWYWLNAGAGVLNPFPLKLGPDDGPIAISADGAMVAVANVDHGALIQPINSALPLPTPSSTVAAVSNPTPTPSPVSTTPRRVNSKLHHPDGLAWSPDGKQLAVAVNGEVQLYNSSAADGPPAKRYLAGGNVTGISWSGPITDRAEAGVKTAPGPQAMIDALLTATRLPAKADTAANRPLTRIYVWQFDSSKASPIAAITEATPAVLDKYPPLAASVVYHHWAAIDTWALLGGCYRYRVVVTGSIAPTASTLGLAGNALCSAKPSASASPA